LPAGYSMFFNAPSIPMESPQKNCPQHVQVELRVLELKTLQGGKPVTF